MLLNVKAEALSYKHYFIKSRRYDFLKMIVLRQPSSKEEILPSKR